MVQNSLQDLKHKTEKCLTTLNPLWFMTDKLSSSWYEVTRLLLSCLHSLLGKQMSL